MRDILVVLTFLASLTIAIRSPFVAILVYYWISVMAPHKYTWGFARDMPLAFGAAAVAMLSAFFHFRDLRIPRVREFYFFLAFWIYISITTRYALYPELAHTQWVSVSKVFLLVLLTMLVIRERRQVEWFIIAFIAYIGVISVKGAVFGILTGGQFKVWGPVGSNLQDNNFVGVAMVMILPLCLIIRPAIKEKWISTALLIVGISSIIVCILTYSRGALVGLSATGFFFFLKSQRKLQLAAGSLVAITMALFLLPDTWFERMNSLKNYQKDSSANQRFDSWRFSYRIAKEYPFGAGFECFQADQYYLYADNPEININRFPDGTVTANTAHSIYFEVMAEQGFVGLALYLIPISLLLLSLQRMKRLFRFVPGSEWISYYADALTVSILGFMISAAFVSRAYFESFWVVFAAALCFKAIVYSGEWIEESLSENPEQQLTEDGHPAAASAF